MFKFCATLNIIGLIIVLWTIRLRELAIPPNLTYLQELAENGEPPDELRKKLFIEFRYASEENSKLTAEKAIWLNISYYITALAFIGYIFSKLV